MISKVTQLSEHTCGVLLLRLEISAGYMVVVAQMRATSVTPIALRVAPQARERLGKHEFSV
ncbi:hypothetical protein [Rivibacter subsaxonicus]|uniref:hypothetical protein n=1 Tax=Rivibacter subsaxonicus TaxID=457575 RepID=UPI00102CDDEC|nr:hypothetical protein [Rivibacter subsaxonicus]